MTSSEKTTARIKDSDKILAGKYLLLGVHGETELSTTYIVRDLASGQHLIAKTIKDPADDVARIFVDAAIRHGRLQHENIVQTIDYEEASETEPPFFIEECIEGITLAELIEEVGTLEDDDEIETFLSQICAALEYAHGEGIVHGGLKPSNVMLTQAGDEVLVKLLDFGAINASRELPGNLDLITGSEYLAPEQIEGEPASKVADVYSLGVLAYQLITGFLPDPDAVEPIAQSRPDIACADLLDGFIQRALSPDPSERLKSVAEFHTLVNRWYSSMVDSMSGVYTPVRQPTSELEQILEEIADSEEPEGGTSLEEVLSQAQIDGDPGNFNEPEEGEDEVSRTLMEVDAIQPFESLQADETDDLSEEDLDVARTLTEVEVIQIGESLLPPEDNEDLSDEDLDVARTLMEVEVIQIGESLTGQQPEQEQEPEQDSPIGITRSPASPVSSSNLKKPEEPSADLGSEYDQLDDLFELDEGDGTDSGDGIDIKIASSPTRFSSPHRLPAMAPPPGMEMPSDSAPHMPSPERSSVDARTRLKKAKLTKRSKPKVQSTMNRLMALKQTQVNQQETMTVKFSESFAQEGPRQSPKMIVLKFVVGIAILGLSTVLFISNLDMIGEVFQDASRKMGMMLVGKQQAETQEQLLEPGPESTASADSKTSDTASASVQAPNDSSQAPPAAAPAGKRRMPQFSVERHYVNKSMIVPKDPKGPSSDRQVVYPYLFTKEDAARIEEANDPHFKPQPRETDSEVKEITAQ
ncbi:MAG: serine/threonine protein kinase [Cyanobacteria bacterium HKST-UBA02]|nr:serine/threonine protein kinase [Cyanobacteria bacterium HKST-UBA02]